MFSSECRIEWLRAALCRSELLIEIEGLAFPQAAFIEARSASSLTRSSEKSYARDAARPGFIDEMFDHGAESYEWVCRIMSLGTGSVYRRQALINGGLAQACACSTSPREPGWSSVPPARSVGKRV